MPNPLRCFAYALVALSLASAAKAAEDRPARTHAKPSTEPSPPANDERVPVKPTRVARKPVPTSSQPRNDQAGAHEPTSNGARKHELRKTPPGSKQPRQNEASTPGPDRGEPRGPASRRQGHPDAPAPPAVAALEAPSRTTTSSASGAATEPRTAGSEAGQNATPSETRPTTGNVASTPPTPTADVSAAHAARSVPQSATSAAKPALPATILPLLPATAPGDATTSGSINRGRRTLGYFLAGTGVLGLGTGLVTNSLAQSRREAIRGHCDPERRCDPQDLKAEEAERALTTASTISFAVGAAALGAGVYFLLSSESSEQRTTLMLSPKINGGMLGVKRTF